MNQSRNNGDPRGHHEIASPEIMVITPVVSVNMITYNHGLYLAQAIEGVIKQNTDFPIELVIAEDCSTDNTREIALDYQRRYPHLIRVIYSDQNVGMMANDRRAVAACRGEFIAYCEGDDYWIDPEKLREQVAALSKCKNIDIAFHRCYVKYERQNKKLLSNSGSSNTSTDKVFTLPEVVCFSQYAMPTASLLIRRRVHSALQDWMDATSPPIGDTFIRVFGARNGGAYYINKPMSVYRTEMDGSWSERTVKTMDVLIEFHSKFLLSLKKLGPEMSGQQEAFKRLKVYHYSCLLKSIKKENLAEIRDLMFSVLKDIYEPAEKVDEMNRDDQLEGDYYLKFAVDSGKSWDMADWNWEVGLSYQFLRVVKSLFDYGILILILLNHSFYSNGYEKKVLRWKAQALRIFLIARGKRLCKAIIGNTI